MFTGVGLACRDDLRARFQSDFNLKVSQGYSRKTRGEDSLQAERAKMMDSKPFPLMTSDEESHGYCLFPGDSMMYKFTVLCEEFANTDDLNLWVEGTLSRRHLLHFQRRLTPSSS